MSPYLREISPHLQLMPSVQQRQQVYQARAQLQRMQNIREAQQLRRQKDKVIMQEDEPRQQGQLLRKLGSTLSNSTCRVRRLAIRGTERAPSASASPLPRSGQGGKRSSLAAGAEAHRLSPPRSPITASRLPHGASRERPLLLAPVTSMPDTSIPSCGEQRRKSPRKPYRHTAIETRLRNSQTEMVVYFVVLLATIIGLWTVLDIYGRRLSARGTNGSTLLLSGGNASYRDSSRGGGRAFVVNGSGSSGFRICSTTACQQEGSFVSHQLNWNINPCDSMYRFVCSKWRAAHSTLRSVDEALTNQLEVSLLRSLRGQENTSPSLLAMQQLWKECVDSPSRNHLGWTPLKHFLKSAAVSDWPYVQFTTAGESAVWEAAARALRFLGLSTLVNLEMIGHPARPQHIVPALDKPDLLDTPYGPSPNASSGTWYYDAVALAVTAIAPSNVAFHAVSMEVANFAHHLAGIVHSPAFVIPKEYRVERLASLPRYRAVLSKFLENSSRVDEDTELVLRSPEYVVRLTYLLDDTPPHIVLNYIGFRTVVHVSPFLPDRVHKLTVVRGRQLGLDMRAPKEELCLRVVQEALPVQFYRALYESSHGVLQSTGELSADVQQAVLHRLEKLQWMDHETRSTAAHHLRNVQVRPLIPAAATSQHQVSQVLQLLPPIIPGEGLRSYVRVTRYLVQRQITEGVEPRPAPWPDGSRNRDCSYDLSQRTLYLPLTAVNASGPTQEPLALFQLSRYGVHLGRCLIRPILDGAFQPQRANDPHFWWSATSRQGLAGVQRCYAMQHKGDEAAARAAAEEAVALVAAHTAFRDRFSQGLDLRLENALSLSLDQLFFIYYALGQCSDDPKLTLRVDLALVNYMGFQKSFTCDPGTPMNPRKACHFW